MKSEQISKFNDLLEQLRDATYASNVIDLTGYGINDSELHQLLNAIKNHPKINAQIETLNLTGHNFNFSSIEGLTGLKHLTLDNKSGNRSTHLALANLPQLKILHARKCRLETLSFQYITNLQTIDLWINRLKSIDLDDQVGLVYLKLRANRFEELNLSGLRYLKKLDVSANPINELFLGENPLSQGFLFCAEKMSENSKKQIWARYHSNGDVMQDLDPNYKTVVVERTEEIKNSNMISAVADLESIFVAVKSEFVKNKLNALMIETQKNYAYMQVSKIPADSARHFVLDYFKNELRQRFCGMLQQFDSVVPLLTADFIKVRVEPFIQARYNDALKNLKNPKFTEIVSRLERDNNVSLIKLPTKQSTLKQPNLTWLATSAIRNAGWNEKPSLSVTLNALKFRKNICSV